MSSFSNPTTCAGEQRVATAKNLVKLPLVVCGTLMLFLLGALFWTLGVSLLLPGLVCVLGVFFWFALRHPVSCIGAILFLLPLDPLGLLIARFYGPSFLMADIVKGFDRVILLVPVLVLLQRNRLKLSAPDWILVACFILAFCRFAFGGSLVALVYDWGFILAYLAGRVTILNPAQQICWAKRAVWFAAFLSLLGMFEIFILGPGPRAALVLVAEPDATENGALNGTYYAEGFAGLRESSTMFGPLQFASFCMVALVLWYVYSRKLLSGGLIAAGLIFTVTRSAWIGTAVALLFLAIIGGEWRRFRRYAVLALIMFSLFVSLLGLGTFLSSTLSQKESSAEGHRESLSDGLAYVLAHPLGAGPGNAGSLAYKDNSFVVWTENSYLTLAASYGLPVALCFVGFLFSVLRALRQRTLLSYSTAAIVVGLSVIMMFMAGVYDVFSVACWVWFPVGLAIRYLSGPQNDIGGLN